MLPLEQLKTKKNSPFIKIKTSKSGRKIEGGWEMFVSHQVINLI